jgi:integrase
LNAHGDALQSLRVYAADTGEVDPDEWLFPDPSGVYPIGGDVLVRRFKAAENRSSLSGFVIRDMRHTVITMMGEASVDPASAQGISGHSDLTTLLNTYTHIQMAGKRRAISAVAERIAACQDLASESACQASAL